MERKKWASELTTKNDKKMIQAAKKTKLKKKLKILIKQKKLQT